MPGQSGSSSHRRRGSQNRSSGGNRPGPGGGQAGSGGGRGRSGGGGRQGSGGGGRNRSNQGSRGGGQRRPSSQPRAAVVNGDTGSEGDGVLTAARRDVTDVIPGKQDAVEAHRNRRHALGIAALPAVVLFGVLSLVLTVAVSPIIGVVAGAAGGLALWAAVWFGAMGLVLRSLGCSRADEDDLPRVFNLVDGLCATMGVAVPTVCVIDDPTRNALVVGRRPATSALVVTTGLVDALDPVALEGALAHELSHVRRNDVAPATVAAAIFLPLASLWPAVGDVVHGLAGRGREFRTDQAAVSVTRYPPGLREALAVMEAGPPPRAGSVLAGRGVAMATRRLWTVALPHPSRRTAGPEDLVGDLDATSVRIAALDEW